MSSSAASEPDSPSRDRSSQAQAAVDRFVPLWGEMTSAWEINRTTARIHALLYCAERPLNTDEITGRLDASRDNANMNRRSLIDWNPIEKTRRPESRKDFCQAETDMWQVTARPIEERERREIHPVRLHLEEWADLLVEDQAAKDCSEAEQVLCRRFANLIDLVAVPEGASEALLSFVRNKAVDQVEQLLDVALQPGEAGRDAPSDSSYRNPCLSWPRPTTLETAGKRSPPPTSTRRATRSLRATIATGATRWMWCAGIPDRTRNWSLWR